MASVGMIAPFEPTLIRKHQHDPALPLQPVISYGLSSYGYDIRLSSAEFRIFRHIPGTVVDPKNFNPENLEQTQLHTDSNGNYFILPAHSYGLGVALEKLNVPANITVICIGKSSYARCGIIANLTPAEACMSDDTEILAKTGWKLLKDVILGEEVLTWNEQAKTSEYQPVMDKQAYYFNGNLLNFAGKYVDQLVTPQHRMWVAKRLQKSLVRGSERSVDSWKFEFEKAVNVYGAWNYYLSRDLHWQGENNIGDRVLIGKYSFSIENWLKFLGCWLGDGSAYDDGRGNYVIKLAVTTKVSKRNYFRVLLAAMKVNYHESEYGFSFQDKAVYQYLKPYCGAKNKRIPRDVMNLPSALLANLIEGMMHSDGNLETNTYCSVSRELISDFQELCMKAGYNCSQWEYTEFSKFVNQTCTQHRARYSSANITPNKLIPDTNMHSVPYTGMVYDITVPNHVFLSRRNGKASWTGNSWRGHLTLEFSNSSSADCRIYANEGVVQLLFLEGEPCAVSYDDRQGKYQDQAEVVTLAKV